MSTVEGLVRKPESRYSYYRRCQVFRRNGEQCKAPAEKGAHICYAHAGQLATAVRRERERRAVLAEAVAEMRRRGKPECEMADLFTDFKGIQVTLAVMAQALIDGRIDCKTAGRLVVHLQTFSKLLWQIHRKGREGRKGNQISPQICADERRLSKGIYHRGHRETQRGKTQTAKDTRSTPLSQAQGCSGQATEHEGSPQICADERGSSKPDEMMPLPVAVPKNVSPGRVAACGGARILQFEVAAFGDRSRAHGPPESKAA